MPTLTHTRHAPRLRPLQAAICRQHCRAWSQDVDAAEGGQCIGNMGAPGKERLALHIRVGGGPVKVFEPSVEHHGRRATRLVEDALECERGGLFGVAQLLGFNRGVHVPE